MIELWNVIVALAVGLVGGAAIHSAYLHSKKRKEIGKMPWNHGEDAERPDQDRKHPPRSTTPTKRGDTQ